MKIKSKLNFFRCKIATCLIRHKIWIVLLPFTGLLLSATCNRENIDPALAVKSAAITLKKAPLFLDGTEQDLVAVRLSVDKDAEPLDLKNIALRFTPGSNMQSISSIRIDYCGPEPGLSDPEIFGSSNQTTETVNIAGRRTLNPGTHVFRIRLTSNEKADLLAQFELESAILGWNNNKTTTILPSESYVFGMARVLRAPGQDNCNTYRIPGIITTAKGTLIAVYDNRYLNSSDLQGDIDVGMSRSSDGGNTWAPMKVIMDMGEWGGKSQTENGIGDPSVLFDNETNTIWVAALWYHGNVGKTAWGNSKPGLEPETTGQFMLTKSTDDGLTWSQPVNITKQVKNPEWYLFFQGPGMGICMRDGTLVFPAQFKDRNQVPHSTLIYSKDHGITWTAGTGAKPNTTEAQVVELSDGSLMLNMRDDQNRTEKGPANGRAVAITADMGKTWTLSPTSNSALPEPNCMASLISVKAEVNSQTRQMLLFSNPNDKYERTHMTVKASTDEGKTWPIGFQYEYNSQKCYGYSCITMVDSKTLGVLYEGEKSLIWQKIPIKRIIK